MLEFVKAPLLAPIPHGFCGRLGGVSTGLFSSLNVGLGSGDEPDYVKENRRRASEAVLPGARLLTLHQIHSAEVVTVEKAWSDNDRPRADGIVTDRPHYLLGILTADCVPVLFVDQMSGIVGAAHAGWKGALAGVTDNVIAAMCRLGASPEKIDAAIGPCIGRSSYEVSDEFARHFESNDPENERFFFGGNPGHQYFDIEGYVVSRLQRAGIERIAVTGLDTYSNPGRYFSYRRSCHANEPDYGRQISLIGLG